MIISHLKMRVHSIVASSFMCSHQPADVFLTVAFNAVHLVLVLLVGCAEISCFGFISLKSVCKSLFGLLPSHFLLLNLKWPDAHILIFIYTKTKTTKRTSAVHL